MSARFLIVCLSATVLLLTADRARLAAAEDKDKLVARVYSVADLVIPLDKAPKGEKENPPANGVPQKDAPQVATISARMPEKSLEDQQKTLEDRLIKIITSMIAPRSWDSAGGPGMIDYFPLGMALVINQTPAIHEKIAELLDALRRLQDVEVAVEVRLVKVSEAFFDRIGLDFDMKIKTAPEASESVDPTSEKDQSADPRSEPMSEMALNDIQVFMFLEAVQGDPRTNIVQAPRLTVLNGQTATMSVNGSEGKSSPTEFQLSVRPVVSADQRFVHLNLKAKVTDPASLTMSQQPKPTTWTLQSTSKIPHGETVLLGSWKRTREVRSESSPPILSQLLSLGRQAKSVNYGRETERVMLLVTPRIVIHNEEKEATKATTPRPPMEKAAEKIQPADPCVVPAQAVTPVPVFPWAESRLEDKYDCPNDCRTRTLPPIREDAVPPCDDPPCEAEILRALSCGRPNIPCCYEEYWDDVQVVTELLVDRVDSPRFYPLIGPAQLRHCHWKCTVYYTETIECGYPFPFWCKRPRIEIVYLDRDHLHLCTSESEPAPQQFKESSDKKVTKLLEKYHQACAEGRLVKAKKLAEKALSLDPACFSKEYDSRRILELLNNSKDLRQIDIEWERIWFTEQPSHMTPQRIHGGIQ